jgi:hypothetical protein
MMMGVVHRAAVARHVLDDADHAGRAHPFQRGPAHRRDPHRLMPIGPRRDRVGRVGARHIEDGGAVHVDADLA